jgi:DNA-binding response OmpR family regulator
MAGGVKQWLAAFRLWLSRSFESRSTTLQTSVLYGPDVQRLTAGSMPGKDELNPLLTHRRPRSRKHPYQGKVNADAIEAGDFSIDLATRSVTVRGQPLELTSAEFEMLVFLTGHHKSVVTPNTMLAANWSGREIGQADFVRVLVSLRKKLDSITGSTPSYIRTESWIFYNFSPTLAHRA